MNFERILIRLNYLHPHTPRRYDAGFVARTGAYRTSGSKSADDPDPDERKIVWMILLIGLKLL
jgi:hypothetical protein